MKPGDVINFRYRVIREIGEGGSGKVYLVSDQLSKDQTVALKVLTPQASEGESEESYWREISTLTKLHHPNLVRIHDFGTVRHCQAEDSLSCRFFTMEYLNGTDALEWISGISKRSERDELILDLLLQALNVLAYIHHLGVIHFDIKPQNLVVIEEPGQEGFPFLKVVDFGLCENLLDSHEIQLRGTPEYAAPELFGGGSFDHRIDLYSLGASFFYLIEGHPPFEAPGLVDLVKQVLSAPVELTAPTSDAGNVLSRVVHQLMEREPDQRPVSAQEAVNSLSVSGGEIPARKQALPVKPRFVGRRKELERFHETITAMRSDKDGCSAMILRGGEGIGKSSLLREMAVSARSDDFPVFETDPHPSPLPFNAVNKVLGELICEAKSRSAQGREIVEKFHASLELSASGEPAENSEVARQEFEILIELRSRFITECGTLFAFIIVADNLDEIDDESRRVLETVVRDLDPARILFLGAEGGQEGSVLRGSHAEIILPELGQEELSEMVQSIFGPNPALSQVGGELHRLYGGIPALVVAAMQSLSPLLTRETLNNRSRLETVIASLETELPRSLEEFLARKYDDLRPEERLILDVMSRFHGPARVDVMSEILPFHKKRIERLLQLLESREFISSTDNNRYFIRSRKLSDLMPPFDEVAELDLRSEIAATLQLAENLSLADFEETGFQLEAADNDHLASVYFEKGADEAGRVSAFNHSLDLYRRAAAAAERSGDSLRHSDVRRKLTSSLFFGGCHREAIEHARSLLTEDQNSREENAKLLKIMGCSESRLGEFDQARADLNKALTFADDDLEKVELKQELAGIEINVGHFQDAEATCRDQLQTAGVHSRESLVAAIYTDLGIATFLQGRYDESISHFTESLKRYQSGDQWSRLADAMNNIANALSERGDVTEAIQYWNKALEVSEAHASLNRQAEILNNLGIAHYKVRKYEQALDFYHKAGQIFGRIGSTSGRAYNLTNTGEVWFAELDYEKALGLWTEALSMYETMGDAHGLTETCLQLAELYLVLGDTSHARDCLDKAQGSIEEEDLRTFSAPLEYHRGVLESDLGGHRSAVEHFLKARAHHDAESPSEEGERCTIRIAECHIEAGDYGLAVEQLGSCSVSGSDSINPQLSCEAFLLLARIAEHHPQPEFEKPVVYLREGLERIAREPVTETSWRIAYRLGQALQLRGQTDRAKESFRKAEIVLNYILSKFDSETLRLGYLESGGRKESLSEIRQSLRSGGK